jgi:hypothetical protein
LPILAKKWTPYADDPTLRQLQDRNLRGRSHSAPLYIEGRGFRAVVEIETLALRAGDVRKATEAMEWAALNTELLRAEWTRLNQRD